MVRKLENPNGEIIARLGVPGEAGCTNGACRAGAIMPHMIDYALTEPRDGERVIYVYLGVKDKEKAARDFLDAFAGERKQGNSEPLLVQPILTNGQEPARELEEFTRALDTVASKGYTKLGAQLKEGAKRAGSFFRNYVEDIRQSARNRQWGEVAKSAFPTSWIMPLAIYPALNMGLQYCDAKRADARTEAREEAGNLEFLEPVYKAKPLILAQIEKS